jgi:hypothetical protein
MNRSKEQLDSETRIENENFNYGVTKNLIANQPSLEQNDPNAGYLRDHNIDFSRNKEFLVLDKKPSKEQIKEFWEWCGLTQNHWTKEWFVNPHTRAEPQPVLDLNNLFKYAVPKLHTVRLEYDYFEQGKQFGVSTAGNRTTYARANDPALALFWAIWEVIHG